MRSLNPTTGSLVGSVKEVVVYGDSIPAGGGVSESTRDVMTRFASMIGAQEVNWACGGAALFWTNDATNAEFGTIAAVLQTHKRPVRAASTLNAGVSVGGTSVVIPHGSTTSPLDSATGIAFKVNDIVHVGDGSTGEIAVVNGVTRNTTTSTISLKAMGSWETGNAGFVRTHASGDPIWVVPSQYAAGNTIYFLCETHNALARHGLHHAQWETWFKGGLRACIARLRCAEIHEADCTGPVKYTGTTGSNGGNNASSSGEGNAGVRGGLAASSTVEYHLADNFPGGTAVMGFLAAVAAAADGLLTFTVDGVSAGTMTTPAALATTDGSPRAKNMPFVKRFTGLSAGRHKIVATITTVPTGGSLYFDYAGVESNEPPVVIVWKPPRFYHYSLYPASWKYGYNKAAIAANRSAGDTFVTVNQGTAVYRQIAAGSIPEVGEYVRVGVGGTNEETKIVSSVTGASAPFTINFSSGSPGGSGLVNAHTTSEFVEIGIKDSDLRPDPNVSRTTCYKQIDELVAEFDQYVVDFDPDPALHAATSANTTNPANKDRSMFWIGDLTHPNDTGHALMAQALYDLLANEPRINSRLMARYSRPSLPAVGFRDVLIDPLATPGSGAIWSNMPAAVTELFGATRNRFKADLTNATFARIQIVQVAAAVSGAKLRVQYLDDDGVTWRHLGRRHNIAFDGYSTNTDWTEPTTAAQINGVEVALASSANAGLIDGGWWPIYPSARREITVRIVGIGGDGVADPSFNSIRLDWRR